MKFFQQYPFVRITAALIVGIIAYGYVQIPSTWIFLLIGVSCLAIIAFAVALKHTKHHSKRWLFGAFGMLFFVFLGYQISQQRSAALQFNHYNEEGIYLVDIYQFPIEKERSMLCRVRIEAFIDSNGTKMNVKTKPFSIFKRTVCRNNLARATDFSFAHASTNPTVHKTLSVSTIANI